MKHVPLSVLEGKIIRPGFEKHLTPLLMYRGALSLGRAHRLWNLLLSAMEHEATSSDITQRLVMNAEHSHLCGPEKAVTFMGLRSFIGRLMDNPAVMAEAPGMAEYLDWLLPPYKRGFQLERISEITHRSRHRGAGGWRTFIDRSPVATPVPDGFEVVARKARNAELSERYGVSEGTVDRWRRETGIRRLRAAKAKPAPVKRDSLIYPFLIHDGGKPEHDLLHRVNAAVPKYLDPELRADICQDIIVGILCGDFAEDNLTLPAKEMTKRVQKMFPAKYGPLSLDAVIPGTDNVRLIDTLTEEDSLWNRI